MKYISSHKTFFLILMLAISGFAYGQNSLLTGKVSDAAGEALGFANVSLEGTKLAVLADEKGIFSLENIPPGTYEVKVSFLGYEPARQSISLQEGDQVELNFGLEASAYMMDEVVVTGTLKEVKRLESPVPVEVYNPSFFKKNPTPNIYEALQNVNGVRPQLNCQVCNTGDIHINGLEGPYTMVLIDGMPIVSSLATVYGLSGIPNSLIERMEIVKGPASSLYGSEAIGGLINIITKKPEKAPIFSADVMGTTWREANAGPGS